MSAVRKHDLTRRLAPAAEILLRVLEDEALNDNAFRHLGNALHEMADAAEDDELGLEWPQQRAEAFSERFPPAGKKTPAFISERFTPYVQKIYAGEIEAVHRAAPGARQRQLHRSTYTLARIVASGALPSEHTRESLAAAASDLNPDDAAAIIDAAFRKGLANPRHLEPKDQPE